MTELTDILRILLSSFRFAKWIGNPKISKKSIVKIVPVINTKFYLKIRWSYKNITDARIAKMLGSLNTKLAVADSMP